MNVELGRFCFYFSVNFFYFFFQLFFFNFFFSTEASGPMSVSPRIFDTSEMENHDIGMENENDFVPRLTLDGTTKLGMPGV